MMSGNNPEVEKINLNVTELKPDEKKWLIPSIKWCMQEEIYYMSAGKFIQINPVHCGLNKAIAFKFQQALIFYKTGTRQKAFVIPNYNKNEEGTYGYTATISGVVTFSADNIEFRATQDLMAKFFWKKGDNVAEEVSLANRFGYLRPVKGPYLLKKNKYHDSKNFMVMHRLPGLRLDYYFQVSMRTYQQLNSVPLTTFQRLRMISALFRASMRVHEAKVVHHDMSLKNILFTVEPYCSGKWIDFGFGWDESKSVKNKYGTLNFLAPIRKGDIQTSADDCFSTGVIAGMMLGADLTHGKTFKETQELHKNYSFLNLFRFTPEQDLTPVEKKMLEDNLNSLVVKNPKNRLGLEPALNLVEEIQYRHLVRSGSPDDVLPMLHALLCGQQFRAAYTARKLTSWLNTPELLAVFKELSAYLVEIHNTINPLRFFLEKVECAPLAYLTDKTAMLAKINEWTTSFTLIEEQLKQIKERISSASSRAISVEDRARVSAMNASLDRFEAYFKVAVYFDDLPFMLEAITRKLTRLQMKLNTLQPSVRVTPNVQLFQLAPLSMVSVARGQKRPYLEPK